MSRIRLLRMIALALSLTLAVGCGPPDRPEDKKTGQTDGNDGDGDGDGNGDDGGGEDGGDDGDDGGDGGETVALEAFAGGLLLARCEAISRCGMDGIGFDRSSCAARLKPVFEDPGNSVLVAPIAAATTGQAHYDSAKGGACLVALRASPCLPWGYDMEAERVCLGAFTGKVPDGGPCVGMGACAKGRCEPSAEGDVCAGTCVADACREDVDCPQGKLCLWNEGGRPLCTAPGVAGDDCRYDRQCGAGTYCKKAHGASDGVCAAGTAGVACTDQCAEGFACVAIGQKRCRARGAEGDSCAGLIPCLETLACVEETVDGETTQVCRAKGTDGRPCRADWTCDPGLACVDEDMESICRPAGGEDEFCGADGLCDAGLVCRLGSGEGICVRPAADGEPCGFPNGACAPGSACVPDLADYDFDSVDMPPSTCLPRRGLGEACTSLLQCGGLRSTMLCDVGGSGKCVLRRGPGESCEDLVPGEISRCNPVTTWCDRSASDPVCRPVKAPGQPCTGRIQCTGELDFGASCEEVEGKEVCVPRDVQECLIEGIPV